MRAELEGDASSADEVSPRSVAWARIEIIFR
jgi:hypothetical protein